MFFNGNMSIWILAFMVIAAATLAGWRQGAIRASIATIGIPIATLLATTVGKLVQPLLTHVGASNLIVAWAIAPVIGFILVSIAFALAAQWVHKRVEHFYRYNAGDLRQALWERLNSRVGICIGVLNGAMYFVLASFFVFNLAYLTVQADVNGKAPIPLRLASQLGNDLQATGFSRTASAVDTLPETYYQLSDLMGFLVQNPQAAPRLAEYPAFTSLWERDDMQTLVQDSTLTDALRTGASLGDIIENPNVKSFIQNKAQTKLLIGILETNLTDLKDYLKTGKSAKYDSEKIIGLWDFNPSVSVAWLRQSNPKIPASEMRTIRAWVTQAYANTRVLATGDNQVFIKNLPRLKNNGPGQPPTTEYNNWKGDWSESAEKYDLHLTFSGEDKFFTATAEEVRLTIKDGKNLLIFDRAN